MPSLEINDLASIGLIKDIPPYMLPPEAWSTALNVRYRDDGVETLLGWDQVFGTPTVAPHHLLPYSTNSQAFWLYVSLTKAYVWDGANHTDITRLAGDYTATATQDWNSTLLASIPILNNGADIPQQWATPTIGTRLTNLTNWPVNMRAKRVCALGPYLVALNVTTGGVNTPHLVKWSHPAQPGSVPSSWDETDPTVDAGAQDLVDVHAGVIIDGLPLQSSLMIYKEASAWKMDIIGGRFVMSFRKFLETAGILAPRCVSLTGDGTRQIVVTQDDILIHNGNTVQSVLDKKMKKTLFNNIDTTNYRTSFTFVNPNNGEFWFCYPTQGSSQPNAALIWNYATNAISEADGITFRHAAVGNIEDASDAVWEDEDHAWEADPTNWANLQRRRVLLAGTDATKIYRMDSGITRDGVAFLSLLQREGLALVGKKRNGQPIVDHEVYKLITELWPKMQGAGISIRLGSQELVDGPVSWDPAASYDPSSNIKFDVSKAGRAIAIEIAGDGTAFWRLDGYKSKVELLGRF